MPLTVWCAIAHNKISVLALEMLDDLARSRFLRDVALDLDHAGYRCHGLQVDGHYLSLAIGRICSGGSFAFFSKRV